MKSFNLKKTRGPAATLNLSRNKTRQGGKRCQLHSLIQPKTKIKPVLSTPALTAAVLIYSPNRAPLMLLLCAVAAADGFDGFRKGRRPIMPQRIDHRSQHLS